MAGDPRRLGARTRRQGRQDPWTMWNTMWNTMWGTCGTDFVGMVRPDDGEDEGRHGRTRGSTWVLNIQRAEEEQGLPLWI